MQATMASLFDGIGGGPLAAVMCGAVPVWASEIEPFPIWVTEIRFPGMKHYGDITKIDGATVEPVDIVIGGSPCQDLSIAGKRAGLAGGRSGLFMEQIRIIKEMRTAHGADKPRFMVWENVPGAFSSNGGEDFRAVLEETARIADPAVSVPRSVGGWATAGSILGDGWSISWRTIDAQYWGVPQRRRRIYLVADFAGQTAPKILFEREGLPWNTATGGETRQGTAGAAQEGVGCTVWPETSNALISRMDGSPCIDRGPRVVVMAPGQANADITQDMCHTLNCNHEQPIVAAATVVMTGGAGNTIAATLDTHMGDKQGLEDQHVNAGCPNFIISAIDCRNMNETGETFGTLQAKENGGQSLNYMGAVRNGATVRRLTPLECERLQGFPDGWTDIPAASDTARYKSLGNSFAVPCAYFVVSGCVEVLSK